MSGGAALKAVGSAAWDIVKEGANVSSTSSFTGAIPSDLKFTDLWGWKSRSGTWGLLIENLWTFDVIDVKLKFSFDYNGQSDKYPGALFINNFTVYCTSADVWTPYTCSISAKLSGKPKNVGSKTKVIAAVPLQIKQVYGNFTRKVSETFVIEVDGTGKHKIK